MPMNLNAPSTPVDNPLPARRSRTIPRTTAGHHLDSVLCVLLAVYLGTLLFEGVIRYLLVLAGLPNVIYFRDAIPVGTLAVLFLRALLKDGRVDLAILLPAAALAFHAAYSAMAGIAFFAIAFGLKIFVLVPYGIAMWPLVRRRFNQTLWWASLMFTATAAGVIANFLFGTMPWEGLEYTTAFGEVSTTRVWWTAFDATPRLPGFARASFDAAIFLGVTGLLTMLRFSPLLVQLMIAACAMTAIVLTTSKGMVLAFPLAVLWVLVHQHKGNMWGDVVLTAVCAAALLLPLSVVYLGLGSQTSEADVPSLLVSVWGRFTSMWPDAFSLLPDGLQALLGAGVGGIGTPQTVGHAAHLLNAGDNFAVYMLISFGLPGLCYYAAPVLLSSKVAASEVAIVYRAYVGVLLLAYGYGVVSNIVEASFFGLVFGLCCGCAAAAWMQSSRRTEVTR